MEKISNNKLCRQHASNSEWDLQSQARKTGWVVFRKYNQLIDLARQFFLGGGLKVIFMLCLNLTVHLNTSPHLPSAKQTFAMFLCWLCWCDIWCLIQHISRCDLVSGDTSDQWRFLCHPVCSVAFLQPPRTTIVQTSSLYQSDVQIRHQQLYIDKTLRLKRRKSKQNLLKGIISFFVLCPFIHKSGPFLILHSAMQKITSMNNWIDIGQKICWYTWAHVGK